MRNSTRYSLRVLLAGLLPGLLALASPAMAQLGYRPALDSALTRRAYALGPTLQPAEWANFSAKLRDRLEPVWTGIGGGVVGLRGRTLRYPGNLDFNNREPEYYGLNHWLQHPGSYRWHPKPALRQLNNRMDNLDIERREVEYERLSMVLREKASKMRKLEAALPVLLFALNDNGQVVNVSVNSSRSKTGLTRRSRGLLLKALRDERFRLPTAQYQVTSKANNYRPVVLHPLQEPHVLHEKLQRLSLGYRARQMGRGLAWAGRTVAVVPVRGLLYHKVIVSHCRGSRTFWAPRYWGYYRMSQYRRNRHHY